MAKFCIDNEDDRINILTRNVLFIVRSILMIPEILIAFVIIKIKRSQDILQGINKLDYLLAVSIFQRLREVVSSD